MKKDKHFHNPAPALSALLAVFLWCMAFSFYSRAISLCSGVGVKWEDGGVSPAALLRRQAYAKQDGAADQPEVTLWRVDPEQEMMSADQKSITANTVIVFGDCRELTSSGMLLGSFPAKTDQSGCAVSSGLAFSLWGSADVLGLPIKMEGDMLYVRGVLEEEEPRLFRQSPAESKELLSNMQLIFSGTGTREKAQRYLSTADFPGGMILELPLVKWALAMIFRLPAILLAAGIVVRVLRRGKRLWLFYLPSALAVLAGALFCMDLPAIPAGFIPTMWSDFAFWKNLFAGHWKNLLTWLLTAPTFRDGELMTASFMTALFSISASAFAAKAARLLSPQAEKPAAVSRERRVTDEKS